MLLCCCGELRCDDLRGLAVALDPTSSGAVAAPRDGGEVHGRQRQRGLLGPVDDHGYNGNDPYQECDDVPECVHVLLASCRGCRR